MSFGPSVFDLVSCLKTEPVIASIDVLCASLCTVRCSVGVARVGWRPALKNLFSARELLLSRAPAGARFGSTRVRLSRSEEVFHD
jgi:hypothetical protein